MKKIPTQTTISNIRYLVEVFTADSIEMARSENENAAYGLDAKAAIDTWLGNLAIIVR